jgi:glycosyltransferase involved in cell wall biosynthesis
VFNAIKYLSRRHEIALFSLSDSASPPDVEAMRNYCSEVFVCTLPSRGSGYRRVRGVFGKPPGTASTYLWRTCGEALRGFISRNQPDIIELQHLNMAAYLPYCKGNTVLLREHNTEYRIWESYAEVQDSPARRTYFRLLAGRVKDYEGRMAPRFERCICVSEADKRALEAASTDADVVSIPSGVDCEYYFPDHHVSVRPYSMVICGSFDWRPKRHNLRVLAGEIFPRIRSVLPQATLTIVGQGLSRELAEMATLHGADVVGAVEDVRPYLRTAALALNFVETGGGIALKVLEAMAMAKPVLSNHGGISGIDGIVPGRHAAVVSGKNEFVSLAASLLADDRRRSALAIEGHKLVRSEYCWGHLADRFDALYRGLQSQTRRPAAVT